MVYGSNTYRPGQNVIFEPDNVSVAEKAKKHTRVFRKCR